MPAFLRLCLRLLTSEDVRGMIHKLTNTRVICVLHDALTS